MAVLFDLANDVNKTKSLESATLLKQLGAVLGLLQRDVDSFMQGDVQTAVATLDVEALIQARLEAKKAKNFAEADSIRKQLSEAGIVLEDTPLGTTWRKA
ncbi:MAG: DALR domain-containing protein, partial [Methylophilus sp.]|jgi:cysteinyl-tRNA synthetase